MCALVQHVQQVVMGTLTNDFLCVPLSFFPPHCLCTTSATLQVLGLLVWTLIAGTEYFRVPAFGWVMFVAVFYWVLTVFFLIVYITMTYTRIPQVPWTTVVRIPQGRHLPRAMKWDRRCLLVDLGVTSAHVGQAHAEEANSSIWSLLPLWPECKASTPWNEQVPRQTQSRETEFCHDSQCHLQTGMSGHWCLLNSFLPTLSQFCVHD